MRFLPRNLAGSFVECRARHIDDPVQRLRFLQSSMGSLAGQPQLHPGKIGRFRKPAMLAALVLCGCLLIPKYKASSSGLKASAATATVAAAPRLSGAASDRVPSVAPAEPVSPDTVPNVWLVDQTHDFETYSNGLRIDNRYVKANEKRVFYPVYQRDAIDVRQPVWHSQPAGIVYHTTESDQARFTPDQNAKLKRIGKAVIAIIQQNRSYHFLIDRFGQVFSIVPESDIANHAGYSVWADGQNVYVNLNNSFLGVAFETQTQLGEQPSANAAQVHAARVLTEMLRNKYHIPASNCVTHAQVSVNPDNMLVGYHTDWAGNFPFRELGLGDNYAMPPPSISVFGFGYDPTFEHATSGRLEQGLASAEYQVETQAASRGLTVDRYRAILRRNYKEVLAALKAAAAASDKS